MTINTNLSPSFLPFNNVSPSIGTPSSSASFPTQYQDVKVSKANLNASRARRIHPDRSGGFVCEICSRDFTRKSNLETHKLSHLGKKPFRCTECERPFRTKSVLTRHERKVHRARV
ncbi:hypothetical protein JAAARDRAFT_60749 [Jaapia argillacea MUCL 33604]|uniref:C2H2-type domain-containing protein n=1 Tax=Jaapia argillacea MUCL 33604 TaxID=933084 RepID=A0A067PHS6_9AGAM|nr:hypothetical protein JAAARDRAFT_60749 [Jaapia argillacea MUCL 33604]